MSTAPTPVVRLGLANYRYGDTSFGIQESDRLLHTYVIGQTGTGKSTLLLNMALQDAGNKTGFALIDPHGDMASLAADHLNSHVIYWDVASPESPYGYNPLTSTSPGIRPLIASGLIETLRKQWSDAWGVRMEHLLRYAILALLDSPTADLRDILKMFLDEAFRKRVIGHILDEQVKAFWIAEFPLMHKRSADALAPIANKLGAFLSHPVVRAAICQPQEPLRFRRIMDEGTTLIVNLSKGRVGPDVANVVGGLLVSGIVNAAFTRQDHPENERQPFFLYVDEFHSFTTETLCDLLSETRKYKLGVVLSQQHTSQSSREVFAAIMGNVGTLISFRVGASDAAILAPQLGRVEARDLVNLPNHRAFLRMMIDGEPSWAFTMNTLPAPVRDAGD